MYHANAGLNIAVRTSHPVCFRRLASIPLSFRKTILMPCPDGFVGSCITSSAIVEAADCDAPEDRCCIDFDTRLVVSFPFTTGLAYTYSKQRRHNFCPSALLPRPRRRAP